MKKLTQKQQWYRRNLLGKIHKSQRYLDYYKANEDVYRQMLDDNFNKRSAANLSIDQLIKLLSFLNGQSNNLFDAATKNQIHYIRHTWMQKAREKNIPALLRFIENNTGVSMACVEALSKQQAKGILAALNKMQVSAPQPKTPAKVFLDATLKKVFLRVLP